MKINLSGIQETLLMPLWSRAKLSNKYKNILYDAKAIEILDKIQYDFSKIDKYSSNLIDFMNFSRAKMIDSTINNFLKKHPKATVINLGAGLDTTFYRIDNGQLEWYDIDLPDVIDIRKKVIPETSRTRYLAGSIFDMKWTALVNKIDDGVLFLSGGVLEYFNKFIVKKFFFDIADNFPESEIVLNTSRMNIIGTIFMKWTFGRIGIKVETPKLGLIDERILKQWDQRIEVMEYYPLFSRIINDENLDKKTTKDLNFYDKLKVFNILHLKFSFIKR